MRQVLKQRECKKMGGIQLEQPEVRLSNMLYEEECQQAKIAYLQGKYEEAKTLVDRLIQNFPNEPNSYLIQGNIYSSLHQYDLAQTQYQAVLALTRDLELIDCAKKGLEFIKGYDSSSQLVNVVALDNSNENNFLTAIAPPDLSNYLVSTRQKKYK